MRQTFFVVESEAGMNLKVQSIRVKNISRGLKMWIFLNIKPVQICLSIFLFVSAAGSNAYEIYLSDNRDSRTGKYVGECNENPSSKLIFKTDKATQSVMLRITDLNGNTLIEPSFVEGCKVIDDNNWSCESTSEMPTFTLFWTTYKVMGGKIFSNPTYKIFNNKPLDKIYIAGSQRFCWFNKTLVGYKKQ